MRWRILPCEGEIAFAHTWPTPRSTRLAVVSTLSSIDVPMPTTAVEKSPAPTCRSASMFVESASTTWVSLPLQSLTSSGLCSMAMTSRPSRVRVAAVEDPKRPSPMTRMEVCSLANDRPFLGVAVQSRGVLHGQGRRKCNRTESADEHDDREHIEPRIRRGGGHPGAQADGAEGRDHLEQHSVERFGTDLEHRQRADEDDGGACQQDRDGQLDRRGGQPAPEHVHILQAPGL